MKQQIGTHDKMENAPLGVVHRLLRPSRLPIG